MSDFADLLGGALGGGFRSDDDSVDRLSHRYTMVLLVLFCVVVGSGQYVGKPIQCWVPAEFHGSWESYTENFCWISNTYYLPVNISNPNLPTPNVEKKYKGEINYYQWVPLILLVQALCFYIPVLIWRGLNDKPGINIDGIVKVCSDIKCLEPEYRMSTVKFLIHHFDRYLDTVREYRRSGFHKMKTKVGFICSKRYGNWLIFLYIITKMIYFLNAIGQLFFLDAFLGKGYSYYGIEVLQNIGNSQAWETSARFPRVTLCDLQMRVLANIHRRTIQCVLPVNLFNQMIYAFVWFWLVILSVAILISMLTWIYSFMPGNRRAFIMKYLRVMHSIDRDREEALVTAFVDDYLRQDGVFILRLIHKNTNDVIINELVIALWEYFKKYKNTYHPQQLSNRSDEPRDRPEKSPLMTSEM